MSDQIPVPESAATEPEYLYYELPAADLIHGEQLAAEINASTGLALGWRDILYIPPSTVKIRGALIEGHEAAVEAAIAAHDPERIGADRYRVRADGEDVAVVHYGRRTAPAEITWSVNGVEVPDTTTDGWAEIEITASAPGPITVAIGGVSITLEAYDG